jgi:hypothetical protein
MGIPPQTGAAPPVDPAALAALALALDDLAADLSANAARHGAEIVVLKGASLAEWLYPEEVRPYGDCDLLVDPRRLGVVEALLAERGFVPWFPPPAGPGLHPPVARAWERGWQRVDLHVSFWGIGLEPEAAWPILRGASEPGELAGRAVRLPTRPARLLLAALHALHHGAEPRPREDLRRALVRAGDEDWAAARDLAGRLEARRGLGAALATTREGAALARRLGLPRPRSLEGWTARSGLPMSDGLERWARTHGLRARARLVRAEILPRPGFMRWRYPQARGGLPGAYAARARELGAAGLRLARARIATPRRLPPR